MLGLRTELALFLSAETLAMGYFIALADHAPDTVLRGIGRRIAADERDHIRFQIDRLRVGYRHTPGAVRAVIGLAWFFVAAGATSSLRSRQACPRHIARRLARGWPAMGQ